MCGRQVSLVASVLVLSMAGGVSADLLAHWELDQSAGTAVLDSSGSDLHGALVGDPQWVAGQIGSGALSFDGSDGMVEIPYDPKLDLETALTITAWVNMVDRSTYYFIVAKAPSGTAADNYPGNYEFRITVTDGALQFGHQTSEGQDYVFHTSDLTVPLGQWTHVAVTVEQGGLVQFYINGAPAGRADQAETFPILNDEPVRIGGRKDGYSFFNGQLDDIRIYDEALPAEEIPGTMIRVYRERASIPNPEDETIDVPRDVVLGWTAGRYAATHDVYLGTVLDDVNDADRANPMDVLLSQGQTDARFDPEGVLELGQTYYWRIDEVNAAPDNTIFKGELWNFTVEPVAYPIPGIVATSNAVSEEGAGAENAVDRSGLNEAGQHSTESADMWLGSPAGADPVQIQFEFDQVYKLHEMVVWNYNSMFELILGFGLKDVTVEYSVDGAEWTVLGDVQLAQATARADYTANSVVEFGGVPGKYVRLAVNSGYGMMGQYGLSEVQILYIPAQAREPQPAPGDTGVAVGTALNWRAGREAVTHDVYLSTDPDALALAASVEMTSYTPGDLLFGSPYYWRVDEVNEADEISVWEGTVWDFMTQEFAVIDDMESYNDDENRIYDTWLDGWINETGSTVGYLEAPFAERTIVNSGAQSMPLAYDNSAAPFYCEAEFNMGRMDLNTNGADTLRLFVAGVAPAFNESADGTILMNAIGTDIWGNSDQFRFAYKSLSGNGSMVARVDSLDVTPDVWVKAGVMIRQSTEVGSTHSFMPMTGGGGNGASWQGRLTDNASSENTDATTAVAPPYWVRIDRAGDSLTGSISPDGETWTQLGNARTIAMADPVLIGLALTSHN
ncbi:MAG: discoidin domain-containing protein, partial [Phycisphaerales bacterium]